MKNLGGVVLSERGEVFKNMLLKLKELLWLREVAVIQNF